MRALIIIQATLLIAALAAPNYANNSAVCNTAPAEQSLALVITNSTICGYYDDFEISMSDIKGAVPQEDAERGSFVVSYPGAKFQINGNKYTSKVLTFRHQSEHSLTGNRTALEMQIEMDNDEAGKPPGVLSFLVEDLGEDQNDVRKVQQKSLYAKSKIVESLNPESWTINLNQLGERLQGKSAQDQYLNLYSYPGTFNYPPCQQATWYIYGSPIYAPTSEVNNFRDLVKTATTFTPGDDSNVNSAQVMTTTSDVNDNPLMNKFCYSGYFSVTIGYSYGLWFAITSILLFFFGVLSLGEKPIKNPRYQENVWTHHPVYSIKNYGNDLHTRKSRLLLLLVLVSLNACFSGVFYHQSHNRDNAVNIIVYAVYASLISFVITFLIGNTLRRYSLAKAEFIQTKDEEIDQRAQNRLFLYYILIFIVVVVAWPVTVWMLNDIYNESPISVSNLWVASFFVGIALELLIYYPLECVIAKSSEGFRNLIKRRGFMYDNLNHEAWMTYYKSL